MRGRAVFEPALEAWRPEDPNFVLISDLQRVADASASAGGRGCIKAGMKASADDRGRKKGIRMNKRKYLNVTRQNRLGRVGARLLLSLGVAFAAVLFKSAPVHAETTVPAADLVGTWVMADIPGSNDLFTVQMKAETDRLVLTLPQGRIHLASGQDVELSPCEARVFCSARDGSPAVRLALTSKNRADLSIEGADSRGFASLDVPLRHDSAD